MAKVTFYQKPGCINNTKQIKLLKAAGHEVEERDLLKKEWSVAELQRFFSKSKSIADCFNRTAPAVKSGAIVPELLSEEKAFAVMMANPILVKRPLMIIDDVYFIQGFDAGFIDDLIGLTALEGCEDKVARLRSQDLETCPNSLKEREN
ncbi:hypothetical protein OAP63_03805 [Vibrio sp.]|nr:hypothetical protein [Vibrio sp.]